MCLQPLSVKATLCVTCGRLYSSTLHSPSTRGSCVCLGMALRASNSPAQRCHSTLSSQHPNSKHNALCHSLSLCSPCLCVSGAPVIATIQKTSGSDDNAGADPDQQLVLCRVKEGNVMGYSFCSSKRSSTFLTLSILSLLPHTVVMQLN